LNFSIELVYYVPMLIISVDKRPVRHCSCKSGILIISEQRV
jgi:hypothetical protein